MSSSDGVLELSWPGMSHRDHRARLIYYILLKEFGCEARELRVIALATRPFWSIGTSQPGNSEEEKERYACLVRTTTDRLYAFGNGLYHPFLETYFGDTYSQIANAVRSAVFDKYVAPPEDALLLVQIALAVLPLILQPQDFNRFLGRSSAQCA